MFDMNAEVALSQLKSSVSQICSPLQSIELRFLSPSSEMFHSVLGSMPAWKDIDAILQHPRFAGLKRMVVWTGVVISDDDTSDALSIGGLPPRAPSSPEEKEARETHAEGLVKLAIKQALPQLCSRGILEIGVTVECVTPEPRKEATPAESQDERLPPDVPTAAPAVLDVDGGATASIDTSSLEDPDQLAPPGSSVATK